MLGFLQLRWSVA